MKCPCCSSEKNVKNGKSTTNKQKYLCRVCGRQFVLNPSKGPITDATKKLIHNLLLEKISLAGIARVTGVSECWLQTYVNALFAQVPREVNVKKNDELLSYPV